MRQLDGLRCLAVFGVVFHHSMSASVKEWINVGGLCVRLFFVISGFLITGILIHAKQKAARTQSPRLSILLAFYARRVLRIFPIYYLVLIAAMVLGIHDVTDALGWHLSYLSNVYIAKIGYWPRTVEHLWSLSVEEQFYIVWPLLILMLPLRMIPRLCLAAIIGAPLFRAFILETTHNSIAAGILMPSCLDTLGVGSLLAYIQCQHGKPDDHNRLSGMFRRKSVLVFGILSVGCLIMMFWLDVGFRVRHVFVDTVASGTFVFVVSRAAAGFGGQFGALLEWSPVVFVGRISYGIYLYHNFARTFFKSQFGIDEGWYQFLAVSTVSVVVAAVSWHVVERPLSKYKRKFPYVKAQRAIAEFSVPHG